MWTRIYTQKCAIALLFILGSAVPSRADLLWGMNGHPFNAYPGVTLAQQLDYIKDLGIKSYRVNIGSISHAADLAELIRKGKSRGIEILPVLTPDGVSLKNDTPDKLYQKAFNFAVFLVSRFKDDVRVWELGNELENYAIIEACEMRDNGVQYDCAWGPAGGDSPLDYYGPRWAKVSAVLRGLSDGTASVDPTIRKAIGTAGWGHVGAFARMQQDGIRWDISVWHMYGQDPEWAFKTIARFNRPIWVTEFNNSSGSQSSAREQADGLTRTMTRLRELQATYNVEAAHIYELLDETYWAPSYEAFMGLVYLVRDGEGRWAPAGPKAAYQAVKAFLQGPQQAPTPRRDCDLARYKGAKPEPSLQVSYSYCLVLGRDVDGGGLKGWMDSLKSGLPVSQLTIGLLNSDELQEKYSLFGLSDADFITLAFRLLLDRDPDGGGMSTYASILKAEPLRRPKVFQDIVQSAEFKSKHPALVQHAGGTGRSGRRAERAPIEGGCVPQSPSATASASELDSSSVPCLESASGLN